MSSPKNTPPLSDYTGGLYLMAYCETSRCLHQEALDTRALIEKYGAEFHAKRLEGKIVCSKCGGRKIHIIVRARDESGRTQR